MEPQSVREALDRRAVDVPYEGAARTFLERERWDGDPLLALADAAASTTGQGFAGGVKPAVEAFRETFRESGRVEGFADLAAIDPGDDDLRTIFGAERKRRVLLEGARALAERPEDDPLAAWAAEADPYRHDADPIGAVSGVGLATFQYLRLLAGVDAVRPDARAKRLVAAIADETGAGALATDSALHVLASCEWLAIVTDYRRVEIDRIAWWVGADESEREAAGNRM